LAYEQGPEAGVQFFREVFEQAPVGLGQVSGGGAWLRVNRHLCRWLGYEARELTGQPIAGILEPADHALKLLKFLPGSGNAHTAELRCRHKDGTLLWSRLTINQQHPAAQAPGYFMCAVEDLHALKAAEEQLAQERRLMRQQLRMHAAMFNATQEGMLIITPQDEVLSCNPAFTDITDFGIEDIRGRNIAFMFPASHEGAGWPLIKSSVTANGHWAGESWNRRKSGELFLDWITVHALTDDHGKLLNYVLTSVDLSRMPHAQTELSRLAFSDPLTGLPNRTLLMNRLSHAISRAKRNNSIGAVMYIDLDGFKSVNDRYGHIAGDELLKQAGARLKARLREVDTIARVGGDEFVALLEDLGKPEGANIVASAAITALATSFKLTSTIAVQISGSIGITLFSDADADPNSVIAQADQALYAAKRAGRSCYRLYQGHLARL
jgi:diguanylate cyclase (GGDEF)-like protein/PAS domain S-box-containing protein